MTPQVHARLYLCMTQLIDLNLTSVFPDEQIASEARQNDQEALAAAKHDAMAARYWKGAIGRAHHAMGKSALQHTVKSQLASSHVHVQTGHARQVRMKQQQHDRKLVSSWHGQINLLSGHIRNTDLAHR